jgi:hypothetical protein
VLGLLGLPCTHFVRLQVIARQPLPLTLVAERWHLRMAPTPVPTMPSPAGGQKLPPMVRDPNIMVRACGRLAGGRGTSTRRKPSGF